MLEVVFLSWGGWHGQKNGGQKNEEVVWMDCGFMGNVAHEVLWILTRETQGGEELTSHV